MNRPLVTIYITNFNYARFIRQSIESVLAQTSDNYELMIIDDGSTDGSSQIIEEYRHHSCVSIIYQQNKGLNITNNIAMRAANGKYLMRLDADDFLQPDAIESMVNALEADPELGLVFPDYYYVDANGNITGEERRHNFEKEVSLYDQPAHGACTMVRLEFLKTLGGYNESFTCQDGYDLWIKFITHHKVTNINRPLFYYRRHGQNLTTNEEKILRTRKEIKDVFVNQHFKTPTTVAIIPVRNTFIGDVNLPLVRVHGKTLIENAVEQCLQSSKISHVVVSSSDKEILEYGNTLPHNPRLTILERPMEFARQNESLARTIEQVLAYLARNQVNAEAIMTLSVEYPFIKADVIDEAINTQVLFKSDSVLSVRPDNRMYYQHTGDTLQPILDQDKFTKLEREALYRAAGGVVFSTRVAFEKNKKLVSGTISHVVVDEKTAFGIFSPFHLELLLNQNRSGHNNALHENAQRHC